MCLGIPMQVIEINGLNARCSAKGIEREASLFRLQHESVTAGDFVIVHLGFAIEKVSAEEAASAWEIYDQVFASLQDSG